jgi:hypothetical protein
MSKRPISDEELKRVRGAGVIQSPTTPTDPTKSDKTVDKPDTSKGK